MKKSCYVVKQLFLEEHVDDLQIEMAREEERRSLVGDLVEYANELTEYILALREEINSYDKALRTARKEAMADYRPPYDDIYSDIFRSFADHPLYEEYKDELEQMSIK